MRAYTISVLSGLSADSKNAERLILEWANTRVRFYFCFLLEFFSSLLDWTNGIRFLGVFFFLLFIFEMGGH